MYEYYQTGSLTAFKDMLNWDSINNTLIKYFFITGCIKHEIEVIKWMISRFPTVVDVSCFDDETLKWLLQETAQEHAQSHTSRQRSITSRKR